MYTDKSIKQLKEVLALEDSTINGLKEDILYKLSKERNGAYLKQIYQHYLQKSKLVEKKIEKKIKNNTISKLDLDFIVDRWADVILRNLDGLENATKKLKEKKPKPENIAHAICLLEADLEYIKNMLKSPDATVA